MKNISKIISVVVMIILVSAVLIFARKVFFTNRVGGNILNEKTETVSKKTNVITHQDNDRNSFLEKLNAILHSQKEVIKSTKNTKKIATIIFGGDMMFDRYIRSLAMKNGYQEILADIKDFLIKGDCVIANLEGPITDNKSRSVGSKIGAPNNFIFTFDPETVDVLQSYNMCLTNIGNNHITNFGKNGVSSTKDYLTKGKVKYIGDTGTIDEQRYLIQTIEGIKFAFINYNAFVSDPKEHALQDIEAAKKMKPDFIIMYTHWGQEYKQHSNQRQQDLAHTFVDAGVDLVIGSHPHVIQESEIYKEKTIYYSLGNFIFDQFFSPEVKQGLLVKATFDKLSHKITFSEQKIKMTKAGKTSFENK